MKCVNCGAELNGNVCEYCGSDYSKKSVSGTIDDGGNGTLTIGKYTFKVYLRKINYHNCGSGYSGRDEQGRIIRDKPTLKRTFIFEEY